MVDMVPTLINEKWEILLPAHRAARPEWPVWEKERLAHMHATTKPGDEVLYIGGEEGDLAALVALWGARVFIVEPNELVFPNIKAIWDANRLPKPFWVYAGFCGKECSPNWREGFPSLDKVWPECAYGPVIGDHGFKELRDPGERPIVTVDAFKRGFDMITMDVEGSEWEVLQGAEWTIDHYRPRIYLSLHPEFLIDQYGKYSYEVRRWLIDKGYRETLLDYQHEAHFYYEPGEAQ